MAQRKQNETKDAKNRNFANSSEGQLTNVISKRSFNQWKYNAKRRGIEWDLTIEYLQQLFLNQNEICPVTHQKLTFVKNSSLHGKLQTASLDRIDSSIGYLENNVRFVIKWLNLLKSVLSDKQLIEYCRNVVIVNDYENLLKEKMSAN